ncbi:uncharacterized protein LOC134248746, partial [Saccostrea cucullata]|uniref:uncharacterized protein LOC134248746 n=1 Tax=Saccostrea cuccullata TaxID=36930 RepID=UPI002ED41FF9
YGISGPFWYAAGASIQMLLFSMVSVQLKIRAPGAKTFLQVIKARFGSRTHKIYCAFALMTNIIVTAMLMLGGAAVMKSLVQDISVEYATLLVTAVIGAYSFIGGLGGTFYVSYFNTGIIYILIMVFVMNVFNNEKSTGSLGKVEKVYALVSCSKGPDDNYQNSFLTIQSKQGLMFGIINIVGNFGTIFVDQSYWQSSVAAKPKQGVIGILAGGLCWFAIPFGLATTTSLAYIALSASQNQALLNDADVDAVSGATGSSGLEPLVLRVWLRLVPLRLSLAAESVDWQRQVWYTVLSVVSYGVLGWPANMGGVSAAEVFVPGVMIGDVIDGVDGVVAVFVAPGALAEVTLVLVLLLVLVTGVVSSDLGLLIGVDVMSIVPVSLSSRLRKLP